MAISTINSIKEILKRGDLIRYLVGSEIKVNYKNKLLGFLWSVLDPFFLMIVYILLVKVIFNRGGDQFPILLFSCLLAWRWFLQSISTSVKILVSNAKLIQTVKVPLTIFPISRVVFNFFNFLMACLVLVPMLIFFDANLNFNLLWIIPIIAVQFVFTIGASIILSYVGIYFSDMSNIIQFVARFWFYLSPALYPVSDIPVQYQTLYMVGNPFASLFVSYKNVLVRGLPPDKYLWLFAAEAVLLLYIGIRLFAKKGQSIVKDL